MSTERDDDGPLTLFPLFLKLAGRRVLVVGGGTLATGKIPPLLAAGAEVRVVAPSVRPEIAEARVPVALRPFAEGDLDGAWLAVAAATPEVNRRVAAAAEARRIFVNAVDDAERATAYTGGVVRRGGVALAVSTEGRAPALAGLLREALDAVLPEDVGEWVRTASALRAAQRAAGVPFARRRPELLEALNGIYAARRAEAAKEAAP